MKQPAQAAVLDGASPMDGDGGWFCWRVPEGLTETWGAPWLWPVPSRPGPPASRWAGVGSLTSLPDFARVLQFTNVGVNLSPKPLISSKLCTQISGCLQRPDGLLPSKAANTSFKHP